MGQATGEKMTRKSGWIIEGAADLCAQQEKIMELVHEWATAYELRGRGEVQLGGSRFLGDAGPEDFDSLILTLPATPEQAHQLASTVAAAFETPMYTREAELVGFPVMDMQTMQPTGEMSWVDLETLERSKGRRHEPPLRELN